MARFYPRRRYGISKRTVARKANRRGFIAGLKAAKRTLRRGYGRRY